MQEFLNFDMEILNSIACICQVKYGSGVEGKGARNNGSCGAPKCAHHTGIEDQWDAEVLLYIAHASQYPHTRVHGQLLGS